MTMIDYSMAIFHSLLYIFTAGTQIAFDTQSTINLAAMAIEL